MTICQFISKKQINDLYFSLLCMIMWHKLEDFQGQKINYGFACHKQQHRQAFITHWDVMRLTD